MNEIVHYDQLVAFLKDASLHEIYRVSAALDNALGDPARIAAVSQQVKVGDMIGYYDPPTNRVVQARVIRKKVKYVLVINCDDGKRWNVPYYALKIDSREFAFEKPSQGLDKNTLKVGDWVGFNNNSEEIIGCVKRLNQKTVTLITTTKQQWRVRYRCLSSVIEGVCSK